MSTGQSQKPQLGLVLEMRRYPRAGTPHPPMPLDAALESLREHHPSSRERSSRIGEVGCSLCSMVHRRCAWHLPWQKKIISGSSGDGGVGFAVAKNAICSLLDYDGGRGVVCRTMHVRIQNLLPIPVTAHLRCHSTDRPRVVHILLLLLFSH